MAKPTIRMLWGLAKCQELSLTDEELHLIVSAHTGKDSIKQLNQRELGTVIGVLGNMKSSASKNGRSDRQTRGNTGTVNQRKKIYRLTEPQKGSKKLPSGRTRISLTKAAAKVSLMGAAEEAGR